MKRSRSRRISGSGRSAVGKNTVSTLAARGLVEPFTDLLGDAGQARVMRIRHLVTGEGGDGLCQTIDLPLVFRKEQEHVGCTPNGLRVAANRRTLLIYSR